MPTPAYLTITGDIESTGALSADSVGGLAQANHEDEILVLSCQHNVILPTDPMAGQPTGNRRHGEMVLTKVFDSTSTHLYKALCEGIRFGAELKWYRIAPDGSNEHYFTMELTNATVVQMEVDVPNAQDAQFENFGHVERVSLRYDEIEWRHEVASVSHVDSWSGAE